MQQHSGHKEQELKRYRLAEPMPFRRPLHRDASKIEMLAGLLEERESRLAKYEEKIAWWFFARLRRVGNGGCEIEVDERTNINQKPGNQET